MQAIILLILDLIIILTFIIVMKYVVYLFIDSVMKNSELAKKIKLPLFISLLVLMVFLPRLSIKSDIYNITDREFNDFNGFVYYVSRHNKKTLIALLDALKMHPDKIKHLDLITGYKTRHININNQSNQQNANIIRVFYTKDRTQCLPETEYKNYFGSDAYYLLRNKTGADTPDGACLAVKAITSAEASKYEYAPPVNNLADNQDYFYFFPFMHTVTITFPVIAETRREHHALDNSHDENAIMEYTSISSKFGTLQYHFGKYFRPSDKMLIEAFLTKVKN